MHVDIKLVHPAARIPTRGTEGASGFDIYACEDVAVASNSNATVRTGICIALPVDGYEGVIYECQVRGRSSLAFKHNLVTHVGTIDSDYRGEVHVKLWNLGRVPQMVRAGERVAQLVFAPIVVPTLRLVDVLSPTARGEGGLGSTGR